MKTIQERTEELRQIAAQARASLGTESCDFSDKAQVKAFEKQTEALFKSRINLIKRYENTESGSEALSYAVIRRRTEAILAYAQKTGGDFRQKYPKLNVDQALAALYAPSPSSSFERLNERLHIETAAAIFLLDQLRSSGRLDEALAYLPESREELDRVMMPYLTDAVHSDDLIRGMLYVIRYRNEGRRGFDEHRAFMNDADALRKTEAAEPTVGRSRFDAILRLLDQDTVSEITDRFLAQINDLTDRFLAVLSHLQDQKIALTETKIRMIEEEIRRVTQSAQSDTTLTVFSSFDTTVTGDPQGQESTAAVEEALQKIEFQIQSFCMSLTLLTPEREDEVRALLPEALFNRLTPPKAGDPYETCFGFLALLDSGCDEIWLYQPTYLILDHACRELPWAGTGTQEQPPTFSPTLYEAAKRRPEAYITPPSDSVLRRHIVSQPFVDPHRDTISFAQLVYIMSGMVPPRGLPELSYMKALLQDSKLSESEIDILYEYLSLAYLVAKRDENYVFIDEEEAPEAPEPGDDHAEELRALKRENKNLKALISKLERRLRESAEALKNADESLTQATSELGELRSMIRTPEKEQADYTTTVAFPYTVKKRIVVFGGHSSWRKAIRPLLPNVRFTDPSAQTNTALILNADVVWIQTNALSHSSFYKIIDLVRKHNIELHYFKFAGAEKCAEQLVLTEQDAAADAKETAE